MKSFKDMCYHISNALHLTCCHNAVTEDKKECNEEIENDRPTYNKRKCHRKSEEEMRGQKERKRKRNGKREEIQK